MHWIVVVLLCVVRTAEVDLLVEGLHDPDFAGREVAAAKIERLGSWAVLGLERGLTHRDPEVRHRCVRLLEFARRSDLEVGLAAVLEDPDCTEAKRLPGWARFRQRYGQEFDARELFVAMMRADPKLSLALESNKENLREACEEAIVKLRQCVVPVEGSQGQPPIPDSAVPGLLTLLLFVNVEDPECLKPTMSPRFISCARARCEDRLFDSTAFRRLACDFLRGRDAYQMTDTIKAAEELDLMARLEPDLKQQVRRLAADLASEPADLLCCDYTLNLTHKFGLDETKAAVLASEVPRILKGYPFPGGDAKFFWEFLERPEVQNRPDVAVFALKLLRDRAASGNERAQALQRLYRAGRSDLVQELEPLLEDATILLGPKRLSGKQYQQGRIQDVALCLLVLWSNQHPLVYGLPKFPREAEIGLKAVYWQDLGFDDEDVRTAALARWRQYQADRKAQSAANAAALQADPRGAALLRQLGSDAWTDREQAVARLRRLGPRAASLLKAGLADADPEVAARCRRLLEP